VSCIFPVFDAGIKESITQSKLPSVSTNALFIGPFKNGRQKERDTL
jgi:hypothetical protein